MFGLQRKSWLPGWIGCAPQGAQSVWALVQMPHQATPAPVLDGASVADSGSADTVPLPRPAVRWVASTPWDAPAKALRSLKRSHALARHRRVALLQRLQYQCLAMDAPADVPREDWAAAVRWQLKDLVEFAVDSAAIDVLAVPPGASYRAQPQLIAVAAPAEQVQPLVTLSHQAGTPWQAIDIAETALRNLSALVEPEGRAQALLHCEAGHSTLVVTYCGELLASRQLDISLGQLDAADEAVREAACEQLVLALQRSLDGIERSFGQVSLARLLITPMPGLDALCEQLRPLLYVPVAAFEAELALDLSDVPLLAADPLLLNQHLCAIGAALRLDD